MDARKASCAAPISMGRGEIPVELCQQPSVFCLFRILEQLHDREVPAASDDTTGNNNDTSNDGQ